MVMADVKQPLLAYLEGKGITMKDLVDTALEFFVPHPGVETVERASRNPQRRIL